MWCGKKTFLEVVCRNVSFTSSFLQLRGGASGCRSCCGCPDGRWSDASLTGLWGRKAGLRPHPADGWSWSLTHHWGKSAPSIIFRGRGGHKGYPCSFAKLSMSLTQTLKCSRSFCSFLQFQQLFVCKTGAHPQPHLIFITRACERYWGFFHPIGAI